MIEIDILKKEYIDGLIEIEELCFSSGYARQTFERELGNKIAYYVVALHGEKVVGYAGMWNICGEADIMNVAVHPDYRKQGIALKMLNRVILECERQEVSLINLEVRQSNKAAQELYLKLGFKVCGERKKYYEGIEDAILMNYKRG